MMKKRGGHVSYQEMFGQQEDTETHAVLYHPVEDGDTLAGLAIKYRVSAAEIKKTNSMWQDSDLHTRKWLKIAIPKYSILTETEADKLQPPDTQRANKSGLTLVASDIDILIEDRATPIEEGNKLLASVERNIENVRTQMERAMSTERRQQLDTVPPPPVLVKREGGWAMLVLSVLVVVVFLAAPAYFYYDWYLAHHGGWQ